MVHLIRTKAALTKNFHISPNDIDKMMMWEYEIYLDCLNELVKEENDGQQAEMDKYKIHDHMKNANRMQRQASNPKMPNMGQMKMPKL